MKNKIFTIGLLLTAYGLSAQYSTPNTGVNWTLDDIAADSPTTVTVDDNVYTLHQDLMVMENDSLSLNANLILKIAPGVEIGVKGYFRSDAEDLVEITVVDPANHYKGFWFYDESEIYFKNTIIEYGGGLKVVTANFQMYDCEVSENSAGSSTGGAISFSKGSPIVKDSFFFFNDKPALSSAANASVAALIEGNFLEGNHQLNGNAPQINMGPSGTTDTIRIINNIVIGDRNLTKVGGISASSLVGVTNKILITGNEVRDNRYGITSMGPSSSGIIADNIIEDNDTEGEPMLGGSGINLYSSSMVYVTNNQIRRNLWGITLQETAQINLGSDDPDDFNPGLNVFSENGNGGVVYALYNNTPNEVKALHNCWIEGEQSTEAEVEEVIFHKNDDPNLGEVFFDPFECGIEMSTNDLDKAVFRIYPNPAKDFIQIESNESGTVKITDMSGKTVLKRNSIKSGESIRFSLPNGIYVVEFFNGKQKQTQKLIVR